VILGYSVNVKDGEVYRADKFFAVRSGEPTNVTRARAEEYASKVSGWIEVVGVLSDEEMALEIERGSIDGRL
jgi:hypothetical protein